MSSYSRNILVYRGTWRPIGLSTKQRSGYVLNIWRRSCRTSTRAKWGTQNKDKVEASSASLPAISPDLETPTARLLPGEMAATELISASKIYSELEKLRFSATALFFRYFRRDGPMGPDSAVKDKSSCGVSTINFPSEIDRSFRRTIARVQFFFPEARAMRHDSVPSSSSRAE